MSVIGWNENAAEFEVPAAMTEALTAGQSRLLTAAMMSSLSRPEAAGDPWFDLRAPSQAASAGLRVSGGGGHQSKTMMLSELAAILDLAETRGMSGALAAASDENTLGKVTTSAAKSALINLNKLYALKERPPVTRALARLWTSDVASRPLLALLCALARDPLLRDTASTVLNTPLGGRIGTKEVAAALAARHPDRFSAAMLRSLAQNCASSWTQSGHLSGKNVKLRTLVEATPEAAAFAAFIAQEAGFGGPAILASPWMAVLDASQEERLSLLRRAQGRGLVRVRHAGAVFELQISPDLTAELA